MTSSVVSSGHICTVVQSGTGTHEETTLVNVEGASEALCILPAALETIVALAQEQSEQGVVAFPRFFLSRCASNEGVFDVFV